MSDQSLVCLLRRYPTPAFMAILSAISLVLSLSVWSIPESAIADLLARKSGGSAKLLSEVLPRLSAIAMAASSIVLFLSLVVGKRLEGYLFLWADRLMAFGRRDSTREPMFLLIGSASLVLLFDWPSLVWGYFESDDFGLLVDNRVLSLHELIYAVNNDHIYPLGRLVFRAGVSVFGANPYAFNFVAVLSLILLVWAGCLFLREAGVTMLGVLLFALLVVGWTMWGQMTSGEYILLFHEAFMTAALFIGWATMRWQATRSVKYCWLTGGLVMACCFTNMAGVWVACAAIVFWTAELSVECVGLGLRGCLKSRDCLKRQWPQFIAIAFPVLCAIAFYYQAYRSPAGPEFLSAAGERFGFISYVMQCGYLIATAIISVFIAIPHHLNDFGLMGFAVGSALAGALFVAWHTCWIAKSWFFRARLIALGMVLLGVVLMVAMGRPTKGIDYVIPTKYLFMPFTIVCVGIAMVVDTQVRQLKLRSIPLVLKVVSVSVLMAWLSHGTASTLGAWGIPFFDSTRGGEIREHRLEANALADVRRILFEPLARSSTGPLEIVDIPGDVLCSHYPALRFPWGQEPPMSLMLDVLADRPRRFTFVSVPIKELLVTEADLAMPAPVSPEFIELLRTSPEARGLYRKP